MQQIIVVEGVHDLNKVKEVYPNSNVVITNGFEISPETIEMLKVYSRSHEIILFLDPDAPGEKIRKRIASVIPNVKHAFLRKELGISKNRRKVGIEHASKEDIKNALENIYFENKSNNKYKASDLYSLGLTGNLEAKKRRDFVSKSLNIGAPNAKTFLNRINQFGIDLEVIEEIIKNYERCSG